MGLETATYISGLNASNPVNATDVVGEGDDHLRLIKSTLLNTFPSVTGEMSLTHTQLNNAAIKTEANVFTTFQTIQAAAPYLQLDDTGAAADNSIWRINATGEQLRVQTINDAENNSNAAWTLQRTANNIDTQTFTVGDEATALLMTSGAGVGLYYNGTLRASSASNGFQLNATAATSTPPVSTDAPNTRIQFYDSGSNLLSQIGHAGGSTLQMSSFIHGATLQLRGEDTGGTIRTLLEGDPDGSATSYYAGTRRMATSSGGITAFYSDTSTSTEVRRLDLHYQDGTLAALLGHSGSADLQLRNVIDGGKVQLRADNSAGSALTLVDADPDGEVILAYQGTETFRTQTGGIRIRRQSGDDPFIEFYQDDNATRVGYIQTSTTLSKFLIRSEKHGGTVVFEAEDAGGVVRELFRAGGDQGVWLWDNSSGNETAIITQGRESDNSTCCTVRHRDGTFYDIGMNVLPATSLNGGNVTLAVGNVGHHLEYNNATARSLFINNDSNIPTGAAWSLHVGPSAGTLTGDGGTGVTIRYWNGSSYTDTAAAGNITLGEGRHFIRKASDTVYTIDGPNIS